MTVKRNPFRAHHLHPPHSRAALLSGKGEALRGLIAPLVDAGQSRRAIAAALNVAGHRTERGSLWNHKTIGRVTERLGL